ncbi:hypothetical protein Afil01_10310 [Actinorhabdospora filicis]|uniref:FAD-binding domain-containing protein n=1 Tax=Actinorhabdospora filicis TaxID=1785913 RepID=A0A9W6SIP3_9ACTN|nr:FAD-dependent monooxygenase [Actinorhabdospora filicis]GLZ76224.1 hypothetical protein Afil01_10310 [Actinorhabdospora filicis]
MSAKNVLISGGSIGGTALAYWLTEYGFNVTIVEVTPEFRRGGQAIDVRGPALEIARRMGIGDRLEAERLRMRGMSMVDAEGNEIYRNEEHTFTGGDLSKGDAEVLREDLARMAADAVGDRVEWIYGDTITAVQQDELGVTVDFREHDRRNFDLVIGADGLHSNTRRLVWGEVPFTMLGTYLGVWTVPNFLDLDNWQIFHMVPGASWGGGIISVRDNTEARFYAGFESAEPIDYDYRDQDAQKRLLASRLEGVGWIVPKALELMWEAPDFHFDPMAQVHLDTWSKGRVALIGDAAHCGSPMSGQGSSLALIDAYVLAGELRAASGDHEVAFAAYEKELREYVEANQRLAIQNKARSEAQMRGEEPDLIGEDFYEVVTSWTVKEY